MIQNVSGSVEDSYNFLTHLGSGGYGQVMKVESKENKQIRACKIVSKRDMSPKVLKMIRNEIELLTQTDHPNIVRVYESFESHNQFNIIMEYLEGGELFNYITKMGTFTEGLACKIVKQVFSAL